MIYDTWDEESQLAFHCATRAYHYDAELIKNYYKESGESKLYRTNDKRRSDFNFLKKKIVYLGELSTDTFGVWQIKSSSTLIFACRGTSSDPIRLLNFIPSTYNEKFKAELAARNLSVRQFEDLPFSANDLYSSRAYTCDSPKLPLTRADIIEAVNAYFCRVGPSLLLYEPEPRHIASNVSLNGGAFYAKNFSDCKADRTILLDSSNLKDDLKHVFVGRKALELLSTKKYNKMIFAGHSLGGSLAFHAFKECSIKFPEMDLTYYGFDAAQLSNFGVSDLNRARPSWRQNARQYRMNSDIVSFTPPYVPYVTNANFVPTYSYDDGLGYFTKNSSKHNLIFFLICDYKLNNYTYYDENNMLKTVKIEKEVEPIKPFFGIKNYFSY